MATVAGATYEKISDIKAQVATAMAWVRVGAGATTRYVQITYEADINTGTSDGLKPYLKASKTK